MRSCLGIIILTSLLCGNLLAADQRVFDVGGTSINIPTPTGFTNMMARYRKLGIKETRAITLAHYLPTDQIPDILQNKLPPALRVIEVKINTNSATANFSDRLFWIFKQALKSRNHDELTAAIKQSPELSDILPKLGSSAPIETTFRGQVPLEPNIETDHYMSVTKFTGRNPKPGGGREAYTFECITDTYLNVKHKMLFLSVEVITKEIQWSRDLSKTWAEEILAANP